VLKNTGNVTLSGPFAVTDDKATVTCPQPASLAVGASITCNATYAITQADVGFGSVTNIAAGRAQTLGGTPVNSNDTSATVNAMAKLAPTIVKTATPSTYDSVNDMIAYSYKVTNSGNVTLHGAIIVSDDKATDEPCPDLPAEGLAPNAFITCTASYTVSQDDLDAGSVTKTATPTSDTTVSPTYTETLTANRKPHLMLTKSGLLDMTVVVPDDRADVSDKIDYTLTATNDGIVTLTGVTVVDTKVSALTCTIDSAAATGTFGTTPVISNQAQATINQIKATQAIPRVFLPLLCAELHEQAWLPPWALDQLKK
jgi:large repetitive protein